MTLTGITNENEFYTEHYVALHPGRRPAASCFPQWSALPEPPYEAIKKLRGPYDQMTRELGRTPGACRAPGVPPPLVRDLLRGSRLPARPENRELEGGVHIPLAGEITRRSTASPNSGSWKRSNPTPSRPTRSRCRSCPSRSRATSRIRAGCRPQISKPSSLRRVRRRRAARGGCCCSTPAKCCSWTATSGRRSACCASTSARSSASRDDRPRRAIGRAAAPRQRHARRRRLPAGSLG